MREQASAQRTAIVGKRLTQNMLEKLAFHCHEPRGLVISGQPVSRVVHRSGCHYGWFGRLPIRKF